VSYITDKCEVAHFTERTHLIELLDNSSLIIIMLYNQKTLLKLNDSFVSLSKQNLMIHDNET
jgi:hypothetical protein